MHKFLLVSLYYLTTPLYYYLYYKYPHFIIQSDFFLLWYHNNNISKVEKLWTNSFREMVFMEIQYWKIIRYKQKLKLIHIVILLVVHYFGRNSKQHVNLHIILFPSFYMRHLFPPYIKVINTLHATVLFNQAQYLCFKKISSVVFD